jgi:hypothetical protein
MAMPAGAPMPSQLPGVVGPGAPAATVDQTFAQQAPVIQSNIAKATDAPLESMLAKDQIRTGAVNEQLSAKEQSIAADRNVSVSQRDEYTSFKEFAKAQEEKHIADSAVLEQKKQETLDLYTQQMALYSKTKITNWWAEASTPAKILGVISQALAGALAGLKGTPGQPTPLDRIIERDIEVQKANASLGAQKVDDAKGMYQTALTTFKDHFQAYTATRELAYKQAFETIDMLSKLRTDEQWLADCAKAKADLGSTLAENRAKDLDMMTGQITDQHKYNSTMALNQEQLAISKQNADSAAVSADAARKTASAMDVDVVLTNIENGGPQLRKQLGDTVWAKLVEQDQIVHKLQAAMVSYNKAKGFKERAAAASTMFDIGRAESGAGAALAGPELANIRAKYPATTDWTDPRTHMEFKEDIEKVFQQKIREITNMTSGFIGNDGKALRYKIRPIPGDL